MTSFSISRRVSPLSALSSAEHAASKVSSVSAIGKHFISHGSPDVVHNFEIDSRLEAVKNSPKLQAPKNRKEHAMANAKFQQVVERIGIVALAATVVLAFPAWATSQDTTKSQVTFTKDIAPIFQEKCEGCHR